MGIRFCSSNIPGIFTLQNICQCSLPDTTCFDQEPRIISLFWLVWKMSPKTLIFAFPDNCLIFNWFILHIWQQKRFWLIAFLTNLWYSSMVSYDGDMTAVNYKQKTGCWKLVYYSFRLQNISRKFIF